ncbi:glycosyltransferase [Microbacterium sp. LWH3-1.2]|uniref:glycosyltransferase n=1 Tax=Microbacterium sp. LWH3-1.2 TaxID=3135256 RepID=UPI00341C880A
MKILHVTETLAAGVLDVIAAMATSQRELGHSVAVLHVDRPETPPSAELDERLEGVDLIHLGHRESGRAKRLAVLARALGDLAPHGYDIVHLHSTFAGLVGRIVRIADVTIYSPHGYSFLRANERKGTRIAYLAVERILRSRSALTLCVSEDERIVAMNSVRAKAITVRNTLNLESLGEPARPATRRQPKVVNVGRWAPQKGPDRFVRAASALSSMATFRWIGDAPTDASHRWSASGWLDPNKVLDELRSADVIYFTSRWEGMPVGLMQAQALGVPAVAVRCSGVDDVVIDGVTGIVADDEATALRHLEGVLRDSAALRVLADGALSKRTRFSDEGYGEATIHAYRLAGAR